MTRLELPLFVAAVFVIGGCDQLGNPPQYATGPTPWDDQQGKLVTTTRTFKNEKTIRRLVSGGLEGLDHTVRSIGPGQVLTVVVVVPRRLAVRGKQVTLATIFKLANHPAVVRRWKVESSSDRWTATFALPEPPRGAVTSVAP